MVTKEECVQIVTDNMWNMLKIMRRNKWLWEATKSLDATILFEYHYGEFCGNNGIIRLFDSIVLELRKNSAVAADVQSRKLLRVSDKELSGIKHNQVLDLDDDGTRWEGDVLDETPYGWGVVFDTDNNMAYEGFRIGEVNSCYGTRYYSDIGVIEYKGHFCAGKRWGRGIQYDRNGNVMFDGEWIEDDHLEKKVTIKAPNLLYHNRVEELTICSNDTDDWFNLDFSCFPNLRHLMVRDGSFDCIEEVKLIGLSQLETVRIGNNCFDDGNSSSCINCFVLKDCPRVRELQVGTSSFYEYRACVLQNLPSLETIIIGELLFGSGSFGYADLELKNLPKLKTVVIGKFSFSSCVAVHLENLPELTSFTFGIDAFSFQELEKDTLFTMKCLIPSCDSFQALPKLTTFKAARRYMKAFCDLRRAVFADLPSIVDVRLPVWLNRVKVEMKDVSEVFREEVEYVQSCYSSDVEEDYYDYDYDDE